MNTYDAYQKLLRVVDSCVTLQQLKNIDDWYHSRALKLFPPIHLPLTNTWINSFELTNMLYIYQHKYAELLINEAINERNN